ncbi:MAG: LysR family transcriptional regulator [Terracidiphilus sp.]|nr:LysR family transcriptional regulator [Terracidiphilus sp.]
MFELRQLQCFVAVGEELHFGRAARRLNMTQPPLSRQIQLLEHALGVQLLERTTRSVLLTSAGRTFLSEARRLLRAAEAAMNNAMRAARGELAPVRLGFTSGASYDFLPRLLTKARSALPEVEFLLRQITSREQLEALRAREIDAGLLRAFDIEGEIGPEFRTACVVREKMLLVLPAGHRLAKGRLPGVADIEHEPFISYSQLHGNYFYRLVRSYFAQAGVTPHYVQQVSQLHSILALVSAGIGLSILPESSRNLHYRGVVLRSTRERLPSAELHLIWRSGNQISTVASLIQTALQLDRE